MCLNSVNFFQILTEVVTVEISSECDSGVVAHTAQLNDSSLQATVITKS